MNAKTYPIQLQETWRRLAAVGFLLVLALLLPALGWPQPVTGPLVNTLLLVTVETLGLWPAIALGFVTPLGALLHGVLPLPLAVMIPFIIVGNATVVGVYHALRFRSPGTHNRYIALGVAAVAKFGLLYAAVTFFAARPLELALSGAAHKVTMPAAMVNTMSWPQLVTALAGGLLAFAVLPFSPFGPEGRALGNIVEIAWDSLCKDGEELCGDWVKVVSTNEDLVVVLSDGLGSGVKANILATLTAEIAADMLEKGASIDEVVETLVETLPECQMRHLAYATFAVLRINKARQAYLAEYDSPPLILVRGGEVIQPPMQERCIAGRMIREGHFPLQRDDYLVMVSDGYIHAGVGGLYRMGWGWNNIGIAVRRWAATNGDTGNLVGALARTCLKLSKDKPGDDATAIAMWVRPQRKATVLTGPPADTGRDLDAVHKLMTAQGVKAICGGTTSQMASRVLGKPLRVAWQASNKGPGRKLPPMGLLEGVNLVTEGILTLSSAIDRLRVVKSIRDLPNDQDAATQLARALLYTDEIHFLVGDAINPQQLADVVRGVPMREIYLDQLVARFREHNKTVTVEHLG